MPPSDPKNDDAPELPEDITAITPEPDGEEPETATDVADRRSSPRRKKLLKITIRNESNGDLFSGWVVDRSLGGMCLAVSQPLEVGTLIAVRRPSAPASIPWVELRVLHVRDQESTWELGCTFTRSPSWELMLQFE
jgi:hypothetical protein